MVEKALPYKYQVYGVIKKGILTGQYPAGYVLNERRLSEELGISRTPVREAIQMLCHDGWVVMETYKGSVVREFDLQYVKEVLIIRKALETLAVESAAQNAAEENLRELEAIVRRQESMLNHYDEYEFIEVDREFHNKLYELSKNTTLHNLLNNYNDLISFYGIKALRQKERKKTTLEEHWGIVRAMKAHDVGAAVKAMEYHMTETKKNIEGYIRSCAEA